MICTVHTTETVLNFTWVALLVERYLSNTASFVFHGITCLTQLIEFAALLTTFEKHQC